MSRRHKLARLTHRKRSGYWDSICEDVLIEIFKRLPIQTLIQSRCVCKRWRSVISSPSFIKLQHSLTCSTTPPNLKPYLGVVNELGVCSLAIYRQVTGVEDDHLRHDLRCPFKPAADCRPRMMSFAFVGSIKGVLCLSYMSGPNSGKGSTFLWNPAIRRYIALPRLVDANPKVDRGTVLYWSIGIGFGYVSAKSEFKVVRFSLPYAQVQHCNPLSVSCEVYSTRHGFWRSVPVANTALLGSLEYDSLRGTVGCFANGTVGCYANGTVHWLFVQTTTYTGANPTTIPCILMFDCDSEEFTTMDLPQELYVKEEGVQGRSTPELLEYGGMLAVEVLTTCSNMQQKTEMWVMEKHCCTWKKLYTVLGRWSENSCAVVTTYHPSFHKMASYGPKKQWNMFRQWHKWMRFAFAYEETMFLLEDQKARSYTKDEVLRVLHWTK